MNRFRQITRLEEKRAAHIKQREGLAQQLQKIRRGAVTHAAVLAFVLRYGNPQIGEPLSEACRRVAESEAWKACCEKYPLCTWDRRYYSFQPHSRDCVSGIVGDPLRHVLLSTLPGADEKDKLNRVFKSAPPWLIWFTFADYSAKLLDLDLPDLSTVTGFQRSRDIFHGWWGLPESAFECRPWPDGPDGEPLARTDLSLLGIGQDAPMTKRGRKRKRAPANSARPNPGQQIDWPHLISEGWLKLDSEQRSALLHKARRFREEKKSKHPEFIDVTRRPGSIDTNES